MTKKLDAGHKCVSQYGDWRPAFGEYDGPSPAKGEMLLIIDVINVAGQRYYAFKDFPDDVYFWGLGFSPVWAN